LTDVEKENIKIVGFPKLLMLSKSFLTPELFDRYKDKLESLIKKGFIRDSEYNFELTEIGKCYIDDIYYSLLEDEEKQVIEKQLKYSILR
jgi:coproporphyrinogen III oxidase-like Fe-S oxidoreductase